MSYNITNWKQKKCEDFVLTAEGINSLQQCDDDIQVLLSGDLSTKGMPVRIVGISEGFELTGRLTPENELIVSELTSYGEGSGRVNDSVLAALSQSRGFYQALLVWEGGDIVELITIKDGVIRHDDIGGKDDDE
jgi:hypothetical protein